MNKCVHMLRSSGDVFRGLRREKADAEQLHALLAAEAIKTLDPEALNLRAAQHPTGIVSADFSRIRNADLGRFTLERLMSILNRLDARVEAKVRVTPAETDAR